MAGEIRIEAATFSYPGADRPVLQDISMTARPGTTTAVVGSTGSGKSTLISLICRLFDVTDGAVRIDGVDVRDYDIEQLWSTIGLVPQRGYLFSGTGRREPALRQGRRDRRRDVGGVAGGGGRRLRLGAPRGLAHARRPGWHQLLRRSAAAARDRPRGDPPPCRSTCSTTPSPRWTCTPTRGSAPPCARCPPTQRSSSSRNASRRSTEADQVDRHRRRRSGGHRHARVAAGRLPHLRGVRRLAVRRSRAGGDIRPRRRRGPA